MNILLDIDGVVCAYNFPKLIKRWFGLDIQQSDITTYRLEECLGLPTKDIDQMFDTEVACSPEFIPGAQEAIQRLSKDHLLFIWSHRLKHTTKDELEEWLLDHMIPFAEVLEEGQVKGGRLFDYFIDDSPDKLLSLNGSVKHKILFDQPWNRSCKNIMGLLKRVYSWQEIEEIINGSRISSPGV